MNTTCPQCQSLSVKRNGYTRHGKQNHRCFDCGRQFSIEPSRDEKFYTNQLLEPQILLIN